MIDGTVRVFLAEALIVPTGLLTVAYLTRQLGPSDYGRYTLAVALMAWLEWGLAAPFGRASVRLLAAATDWPPVASLVIRTEVIAGGVVGLALVVAAPFVAAAFHEPALTSLLQLFSLDLPLFGLSHAHQQVLVALGRFRARALVSAVRWTVRLVLIVAAVEAGWSTPGVILAIVGTSVAEVAVARRFVQPPLFRRHRCRQRQGMQHAAHAAFERLVDHFMLHHPRLTLEGGRDDMGGKMIAIAGKILDLDMGIREFGPD